MKNDNLNRSTSENRNRGDRYNYNISTFVLDDLKIKEFETKEFERVYDEFELVEKKLNRLKKEFTTIQGTYMFEMWTEI